MVHHVIVLGSFFRLHSWEMLTRIEQLLCLQNFLRFIRCCNLTTYPIFLIEFLIDGGLLLKKGGWRMRWRMGIVALGDLAFIFLRIVVVVCCQTTNTYYDAYEATSPFPFPVWDVTVVLRWCSGVRSFVRSFDGAKWVLDKCVHIILHLSMSSKEQQKKTNDVLPKQIRFEF